MARRSQVQEFNPQGVNIDAAPGAIGADVYSAVQNMRCTASGMTRADGEARYRPGGAAPGIAPKWGTLFYDGYSPRLLVAGAAGLRLSDGNSWSNPGTPAGWSDWTAGQMTGGILNGFPVFSAPTMPPLWWNGTVAAALPGWFAAKTCNVLAPFNAHIFAGSIIGAEIDHELLAWSDAAAVDTVPASWTSTATNQAGDLTLGVGVGPVQVMQGLGQNLLVYRTSGCWAVTYSGRPFIYTARKVSSDVGAGSMNAVAQVKGMHAVITPGDFVLTDGTSVRSIGEGRVKRSLFAQISEQGLKACHAYVLQSRNEVVFALALGRDDACNFAYVWDTERDKWSVRELPIITHTATGIVPSPYVIETWANDAGTWDTDAKPWDSPPVGGFKPNPLGMSPIASEVYQLELGETRANGDPVSGAIERTGLLLGDEPRLKYIHALHPRVQGNPGSAITCRVGVHMTPADPVAWGPPQSFVIGQSRRVDCNLQGRYAAVRFEAASLASWSVSGFGLEFTQRGYA
jgi:hypothetical protein